MILWKVEILFPYGAKERPCTTVLPIVGQGQCAAPLFAHLGYQPCSATAWAKSPPSGILERQLEMTLLEQ